MKLEELHEEEMFAMVAKDGSVQITTMAPDFEFVVGMIGLLHKAGFGKSMNEMLAMGWKILPVKVTIIQNGDENKAFQKTKV